MFRFNPSEDKAPYYKDYEVPLKQGDSALDVLDYIYQNLDGGLAYYDHAGSSLGICAQCTGKANGKPGLLCQTLVQGDITLEPTSKSKVVRELVVEKKAKKGVQVKHYS